MIKVLNKREQTFLYATLAVIAFAVIFNLLLGPVLSKNASTNAEIKAAKLKLNKYARLISQKAYIEAKFKKFSSLSSQPGKVDPMVTALTELEIIAKDADVRIVDIRPQAKEDRTGAYSESLIEVRTEGRMDGYLKFIYNLENSLTLLKIKKFQLTAKTNASVLEGAFTISQPALE